MANFYDHISEEVKSFIFKQHVFFVATAPLSPDGHVNLSPKGMDCFRVLSPKRVAYLDIIGSGNETSAHALENGRITFMFCAFDGEPLLLRLYGTAKTVLPGESEWSDLSANFVLHPATRQIIVAEIAQVKTSCGFGVPLMDFIGERDDISKWVEKKGQAGLERFQQEYSLVSLDGLVTPFGQHRSRLEK